MPPEATVFYRFHPLYGRRLRTVQRSGGRSGRITLELLPDRTLSVPQWMLEAEAESLGIVVAARIPAAVLLDVVALLEAAWFAPRHLEDAQEPADATTGSSARG